MTRASLPRSYRILAAAVSAAALGALAAGLLLRPELPPVLYPMPSFALVDDGGRPFGAADLAGRVAVVNFIFTSCPTVCPGLTAKMARLQDALAEEERVRLVSFSVDPKRDTPEVLRDYGRRFGQDPARWTFLTGELAEVKRAVEAGFRIAMEGSERADATAFDIVHGEHFVLVDAEGRIRGYYRPDEEGLARLERDARLLAGELP